MAPQAELWKKILLFGTPALVASLAGLYYYYSSAKKAAGTPVVRKVEETPLEAAISLKNRGNRNFKSGRYDKAVECYTEALEQCPPTAVEERATFYQNRAAARENLRQLEAAVSDCDAALELVPKYLKALCRRARLLERLGDLRRCLLDITACCLLERFQNTDNVLCMDRVLKELGQKLAKEEPPKLPRTLPSPDFIKFYFSNWTCDLFTIEAMRIPKKNSVDVAKTENGSVEKEQGEVVNNEQENENVEETTDKEVQLPEKLASAYEKMEQAFCKLKSGDYSESWRLVAEAVKNFNSSMNVNLHLFEKSKYGDLEKPESARARALLLDATYKALSGNTEEAKPQFLSIGEMLFVHTDIRVNALAKAGSLVMTVDQDMPGCMYSFQQAQTLSPDCADIYLQRGQIHLLAGNLDAAEKDLNEAARLKPDFPIAQAYRLYLLYRKSESEEKSRKSESYLKDFENLIAKFPESVGVRSLYAQILFERGEFQKSDDEFARIIELAPNSGLAYAQRGLLQLRFKQDHAAAADWFKRAIEMDPHCESAWELRGQYAAECGDFEKAEDYFQRALDEARTPQDKVHLFALREGVKAQIHASTVYGVSISTLLGELKGDLQYKSAASGGVPMSL